MMSKTEKLDLLNRLKGNFGELTIVTGFSNTYNDDIDTDVNELIAKIIIEVNKSKCPRCELEVFGTLKIQVDKNIKFNGICNNCITLDELKEFRKNIHEWDSQN